MIGIGRPRRRYQALLRELGVRPPADVDALCKRLAARRGRPIVLRAYPIRDPGVYGMCMSTASTDFIFYEARTSRVHQDHIILHELVHLAAGHNGVTASDAAVLSSGRTPVGADQWLRCRGSGAAQEIEAEALAALALGWRTPLSPWTWARYRRTYRDLQPLWLALRSLCPRIPEGGQPSLWWPPWQMHRRAYDRLIECHDGLVRVGQQLSGSGSHVSRDLGGQLLAMIPRYSGLDADADALVVVSRALGTPGLLLRQTQYVTPRVSAEAHQAAAASPPRRR